jgi:membrane dipeptidase
MKFGPCLLLVLLFLAGCGNSEERLIRQADRIQATILTVDTHCDTPMEFSDPEFDLGVRSADGCVDFPKMTEGGLHAEFFVVFMGQGLRNDSLYKIVHSRALDIFKAIRTNVLKNSPVAGLALTSNDAYRLKKEGRIAAFIGMENGYPIGKDISRVKEYYDLGARYITLTHIKNNDICDSSTDPDGPENDGISTFGIEVVKEMNRLGMMVDVSHISDKAFFDVLKVSNTPVIASHSSCRALCGSPRNFSDDMLLALKENGGVIQICFMGNYLKTLEPNPVLDSKIKELQDKYGDYYALSDSTKKLVRREFRNIQRTYEKPANVKDVVDHIDHVVQVIGIDYVGIGTDFDGGGGVDGCRTAAEVKNVTIELLRRGYSKSDITKIWGGNIMRVMRSVEEYAKNQTLP